MSYEKHIGFNTSNALDRETLYRFGVVPRMNCLKTMLPSGNKEPEPKALLPKPAMFSDIRAFILSAPNAFMIRDQLFEEKSPLTSILLDTVHNGVPTADLARKGYSLRHRFEINPETGLISNRDYNEKSAMAEAVLIGGCADRFERERETLDSETAREGYDNMILKYRNLGDPAFCDGISFDNLSVSGAYVAARTEYGFAVRHPQHPVMFVFEACEDVFDVQAGNLDTITERLVEFEFEAKQVWGELPLFARSPEGFKLFLYSFMTDVRNSIHAATPGSQINMQSKAELARQHFTCATCADPENNLIPSLSAYFEKISGGRPFIPEQYAMSYGTNLEDTLRFHERTIRQNALRMHFEKIAFNKTSPKPDVSLSGKFDAFRRFNDDNRLIGKPSLALVA